MTPVVTADLLDLLARAGLTLATAESLTGGLLADAFVSVPGASTVFRGGVIAYATDLKASLLGVDDDLLAEHGPVHADVARQMAGGVRARLAADIGVASTGVAGPGPQEGHAAGTVFIAVAGPGSTLVRELALEGDRTRIRRGTITGAVELLAEYAAGIQATPRVSQVTPRLVREQKGTNPC